MNDHCSHCPKGDNGDLFDIGNLIPPGLFGALLVIGLLLYAFSSCTQQ